MHARGGHVGRGEFEVAKIVVDAGGVAADVAVAEILGETGHGQQLHFVSRRERGQVGLKARQVQRSVRRNSRGGAVGKKLLAAGRIDWRKLHRAGRVLKRQRDVWRGAFVERVGERQRSGHEIVLPQVRQKRSDRASQVECGVLGGGVV